MNLDYLPDDKLVRIVERQNNGDYRINSPFWKAANLARTILRKRGYVMDDEPDATQEAPAAVDIDDEV